MCGNDSAGFFGPRRYASHVIAGIGIISRAHPDDTNTGALPVQSEPSRTTSQTKTAPGPNRWIVRGALVLIAIVTACVLINANKETKSVADVVSAVRATALGKPDGGSLGDWWISAQTLDPVGRLVNFHVEVGPVHFTAESCAIQVDPKKDTITFEMAGVVLIRLDDLTRGEAENRPLVEMERYDLGPIPLPYDIQ